jgi:hypothetical protein
MRRPLLGSGSEVVPYSDPGDPAAIPLRFRAISGGPIPGPALNLGVRSGI